MTDWKEKNVGVLLRKGTTERKAVIDERDGSIGGHETEHWDGRRDAHAFAKPAVVKTRQGDDD